MSAKRKLLTIAIRLTVSFILVSSFFVLVQDFLIFPGLVNSLIRGPQPNPTEAFEKLTTTAKDGQSVMVWRTTEHVGPMSRVALVFHGNAEPVTQFRQMQKWLSSQGIKSYSMEFRGFDGSDSGWPSEEGLYIDAEAAFDLLLENESVSPREVVVVGSSIGTGLASYIAASRQVGTLVLLSPYSALTELVSQMPLFGLLTRFLKYEFPTVERLPRLKDTCLILAHGEKDDTIPVSYSEILIEKYVGTRKPVLIRHPDAGHNNLMNLVYEQLATALRTGCL